MNYRQIETSREIRLWFGQFVLPATAVVVTILTVPEFRESAIERFNKTKAAISMSISKLKNKKTK